MWLFCDWPVSVSLSLCRKVQKSSPVCLKQGALSGAGAGLSVSQWLFYSFVLVSVHSATWLKSVTPSSGLQIVRGGIT